MTTPGSGPAFQRQRERPARRAPHAQAAWRPGRTAAPRAAARSVEIALSFVARNPARPGWVSSFTPHHEPVAVRRSNGITEPARAYSGSCRSGVCRVKRSPAAEHGLPGEEVDPGAGRQVDARRRSRAGHGRREQVGPDEELVRRGPGARVARIVEPERPQARAGAAARARRGRERARSGGSQPLSAPASPRRRASTESSSALRRRPP